MNKACEICGENRTINHCHIIPREKGQQAIVKSEKLDLDFIIGIYHREFFLTTDLIYSYYIKNMDNSFWSHFTVLDSLGHFNLLENSLQSSDKSKLAKKEFKNVNSSIFRLIRNHIIFELIDGGSADCGSFEIKWPVSTSWEVIIKNGSSAFKRLYRINYILYRNAHLHYKSIIDSKRRL